MVIDDSYRCQFLKIKSTSSCGRIYGRFLYVLGRVSAFSWAHSVTVTIAAAAGCEGGAPLILTMTAQARVTRKVPWPQGACAPLLSPAQSIPQLAIIRLASSPLLSQSVRYPVSLSPPLIVRYSSLFICAVVYTTSFTPPTMRVCLIEHISRRLMSMPRLCTRRSLSTKRRAPLVDSGRGGDYWLRSGNSTRSRLLNRIRLFVLAFCFDWRTSHQCESQFMMCCRSD